MDQLRKLVAGLSVKQRISIVGATLLAGLILVMLVRWHHESDFSPLYTAMAPEDAAAVVQKLKETGVEYRLAEKGSSVSVPSARIAESRLALAAAGLPKTGRIGFELFDKTNFGATDFVEHINYKRALEGELERSIMSLAEVEQARVHLMLPKESLFLDQQQPSKASVMVKLRLGMQLSPQNTLAITNLVASAVEGLAPDAISVVDTDGHLLTRNKRPAADGAEAPTEMLEMRQAIERNLVAKISETLDPLLGANGYRAGASVDYDLTSGEQQEETLDPAHSVMVTSQKSEDVSERAGSAGVPGTASNLPGGAAPAHTGGGVSRRTENITYQTSKVVRSTHIPMGIIKRMSLAVLVDQSVRWDGQGAARHRVLVAPPPETLKTIKDLVAGVTGFNAERGDQLIVETLPFESSLSAAPPPANLTSPSKPSQEPLWLQWVAKYRYQAIAVLIALVAVGVVFAMRRRRAARATAQQDALTAPAVVPQLNPATTALVPTGQISNLFAISEEDAPELAERILQLAKRDPAVTANTLRIWMAENASSTE